jgi:hypothetical protein
MSANKKAFYRIQRLHYGTLDGPAIPFTDGNVIGALG